MIYFYFIFKKREKFAKYVPTIKCFLETIKTFKAAPSHNQALSSYVCEQLKFLQFFCCGFVTSSCTIQCSVSDSFRGCSQTTLTRFCGFFDRLPRHYFTGLKENLHIVNISSTTYPPRLVNVVCERLLS